MFYNNNWIYFLMYLNVVIINSFHFRYLFIVSSVHGLSKYSEINIVSYWSYYT